MVQYPTTQVQDGLLKPQIPLCVQRLSGLWYCYDDQGNLVYIGSSPPAPPLKSLVSYPSIYASTIQSQFVVGSPFFGFINYSGSVGVPVGTSSTYGATTTIYSSSVSGTAYLRATLPVYITVTWGGTFASGETVTVQLTFNITQIGQSTPAFSPYTTLSATATGSQSLNINNIIAVIAPAITTANTSFNQYRKGSSPNQPCQASSAR